MLDVCPASTGRFSSSLFEAFHENSLDSDSEEGFDGLDVEEELGVLFPALDPGFVDARRRLELEVEPFAIASPSEKPIEAKKVNDLDPFRLPHKPSELLLDQGELIFVA